MAIDVVQNTKDVEIAQLRAQLEEAKAQASKPELPPQGTPFTAEKQEGDLVQQELDATEEFVLNSLFPNGIKVNSFIKTFLTMKGKSEVDMINEALLNFEQAARPFMTPDGSIFLTGKPSELIRLTAPLLQKIGQLIGG